MKKIKCASIDLNIFYKKLNNGLDVYFVPYENKNNYFMSLGVKFGSIYDSFVPYRNVNMKKMPLGIAHFLEHKMFESEDGVDPFTFYSNSGTNANASTNYDCTQYICYGSNNIEENLRYLLKYVSSPYFTDENVEKEKGIIAQEINMYDDETEWVIDEELRKSIFKVDPIRNDIAGSVAEINKITKEDLYDCYNTFYNPSNMFLIVSGKFDPEALEKVVDEYENVKDKKVNLDVLNYEEPFQVLEKEKTLKLNIEIPKVAYGIKIDKSLYKDYDPYRLNLYLSMYLSLKFGLSSKFREVALSNKLMSYLYYLVTNGNDFISLSVFAESNKQNEYLDALKKEVVSNDFSVDEIERVKRVWISSEVQMADNITATVDNMLYDIVRYGKIFENKVDIIKGLNIDELKDVINRIDFNNSACVTAEKK